MFNRLKSLFESPEASPETEDELSIAAAALLTHAARLDGQADGIEINTLRHILQDGFSLSDDETQELMTLADTQSPKPMIYIDGLRRLTRITNFPRKLFWWKTLDGCSF